MDLPLDHIVGTVLARWKYVCASDCKDACDWLFNAEVCRPRSKNHKGFISYHVEEVARLLQPLPCPPETSNRDLIDLLRHSLAYNFDNSIGHWASERVPLHSIIAKWQDHVDHILTVVSRKIHPIFISALFKNVGSCMPFHIASIGSRTQRKQLLSPRDPTADQLRLLVQHASSSSSSSLERGWEQMHKAPLLIEWLSASSFLK